MHKIRVAWFVILGALWVVLAPPAHGASRVRRAPTSAIASAPEPPPSLLALMRALWAVVLRPATPVELYNVNTRERMTVWIEPEGTVASTTQRRAMTRLFRCRRTGRRHAMDPGVLRLLADVARSYPGHTIEIVSAFRAPPYGVPNSKHFHGRAIDLRVRGVSIERVRDDLWRSHDHVGVGYYRGQNFIHVDTRPGMHKLGWTSPRRGARYRYRPRWSRRIVAAAPPRGTGAHAARYSGSAVAATLAR